MAEYIYPAPGVNNVQATLQLHYTSKAADTTGIAVPSLQDITVNAANDVFTWTQLDAAAKKQIATTATNSLGMNLVLNQPNFFGEGFTTVADEAALPTSGLTAGEIYFATAEATWHVATDATTFDDRGTNEPAAANGIFGLSTEKSRVQFDLYLGDQSDGTAGKYMSGTGYVTGLAPTVSADAPVWVSPITLTIDSDFAVSDTALA
jgi:hypothetical protein